MSSRFFFITYVAGLLGLIVYGVMALLMPSILLEPFTLHVYQLPDEATAATTYLAALFRLLGFLNVILGFFGLLLLQRYRMERQTWILRLVIVVSLLAYVGPIVFDNTVGSIGFFEIIEHILFVLMVLSGAMMLRVCRRHREGEAKLPTAARPGRKDDLSCTRLAIRCRHSESGGDVSRVHGSHQAAPD